MEILKKSAAALSLVSLLAALPACLDADDFLFDAEKTNEYKLPGNRIAADLIEEVNFTSEGQKLFGEFVRHEADAAGTATIPTILYFHGNKHNLDEFWDEVMRLHGTGADVLIFDYRGYGKSEGDSGREGDLDADGIAAVDFLHSRGIPDQDLMLYGYSLGNVPSLYAASHGGPYRGVVVQSGFASLNSLTQGAGFAPIRAGWINSDRFDNVAVIRQVTSRIHILHGTSDETARYEDNGRLLFDAANQPKDLTMVNGAGHTDLPETMGDTAYVALLKAWFSPATP